MVGVSAPVLWHGAQEQNFASQRPFHLWFWTHVEKSGDYHWAGVEIAYDRQAYVEQCRVSGVHAGHRIGRRMGDEGSQIS